MNSAALFCCLGPRDRALGRILLKAQMSAFGEILLQKSFGGERNFLGPLMRFARRDVRDHIAYQKNDHGASYRPAGLCSGREVEKSSFARFSRPFSSFATLSALGRHVRVRSQCPLFGVKPASRGHVAMSAFPKRPWTALLLPPENQAARSSVGQRRYQWWIAICLRRV